MHYNFAIHPKCLRREDFKNESEIPVGVEKLYVGDCLFYCSSEEHDQFLQSLKQRLTNKSEIIVECPEIKSIGLALYNGSIDTETMNKLLLEKEYRCILDFPQVKNLLHKNGYKILSIDIDNAYMCIRAELK